MADITSIIPNNSNFGGGGPIMRVDPNDQKLCDACRVGDYDKAKQAIQAGANPSAQFRLALGEITPIFLCASKGYKEIAQLLINTNQNCINHKIDFDGTICLHHAASNNQAEMCTFLIQSGCNVDSRDKIGRTPLMDAAEIGSIKVIDILVENECDVNAEDKEHFTALSYCMDFISSTEPKYFDCAVRLIEHGANPNYPGKYAKRTLLHVVAAKGDLELTTKLVETHGASLRLYDSEGRSPLEYAVEYEKKEVAEYLQQKAEEETNGCCILL